MLICILSQPKVSFSKIVQDIATPVKNKELQDQSNGTVCVTTSMQITSKNYKYNKVQLFWINGAYKEGAILLIPNC